MPRHLLALLSLLLAAPLQAAVFVNEIHYDDSTPAGDVGEAIEVVATAGESLADYDLVLYNGSNQSVYATDPIGMIGPVSCGGTVQIGIVEYATNGLQNGAPDGIALVRRSNQEVIQFLSYEGSFTAADGPAVGMPSTDIGVLETNATAPGTSLQLGGGPGSVYVDFNWNASSAETFGNCNNGQTFGPMMDVPPVVSSTVPADNATGVDPVANISIQFSEPVTVSNGWFGIQCTVSGTVAAIDSGGPALYTLDPSVTLAEGENCTVTIIAAEVVDQDETPTNMQADYAFDFTIAIDEAPAVQSTVPTDGAAAVPLASNLSVNFSEPVTVQGQWFQILCASSGAHPAVVSGGPSSYALNPDVDFDPLEGCTLTIFADFVIDQDGTPDQMLADVEVSFTSAAGLSDYYANVDPSTSQTLRASLHETIDDHTRIAYTNGSPNTWAVLNLADEDPVDTSKILDVYRNASYSKIPGGVGPYNREHTWPNSLGFGNNDREFDPVPVPSQQNQPYTDTHMLYLSDTGYNSNRGNKYFGTCSAACSEDPTLLNHGQGGGSGVYPGNSNWYNSVLYEVWNARKGDMARAMFYMDVRYEGGTHGVTAAPEPDLRLTNDTGLIQNTGGNAAVGYMGLLDVLLEWHANDPVTPEEVLRNEVIFSFQGNRNPFIDHPEWVGCIFENVGCGGPLPDPLFEDGFE
jgi:endonuclease I